MTGCGAGDDRGRPFPREKGEHQQNGAFSDHRPDVSSWVATKILDCRGLGAAQARGSDSATWRKGTGLAKMRPVQLGQVAAADSASREFERHWPVLHFFVKSGSWLALAFGGANAGAFGMVYLW